MSNKVTQSVTSRKSDVPSNYIPISSFGCHNSHTDTKASEEYKALYAAWCEERISGIKLMSNVHNKRGQIFVDPADADRVINEHLQPQPKRAKKPADAGIDKSHAENVCRSLASIDTTLDEIYRVLERLTAAVESIATQPKDTEQMVRNEIMAAVGSNGFHN